MSLLILFGMSSQAEAERAIEFVSSFDGTGGKTCFTVSRQGGFPAVAFDPEAFTKRYAKIAVKEGRDPKYIQSMPSRDLLFGLIRAWARMNRGKVKLKKKHGTAKSRAVARNRRRGSEKV